MNTQVFLERPLCPDCGVKLIRPRELLLDFGEWYCAACNCIYDSEDIDDASRTEHSTKIPCCTPGG